MKINLLSVTGLLLLMLILKGYSQIPNGDFEQWIGGNPAGWATANLPGFFTPVSQSTDARSGSYSVKGEVVDFMGIAMSPTLISGDSLGGFPINQAPAAIQGYYKFAPVGGDLLIITAIIYEQGSTVGFGETVIPDPAASYTQFTMDLEYYNPTISPDTCWIQIFLLDTATGQANIGSEYLLDDLSFAGTVDISDNVQPVIPENVSLRQNFPNPFNPSTAISFRLPKPAEVSLVVYNITGEEVIRILNGERLNAGEHTVNWTARNLPSGTYFYQLITGTGVLSRKMVLIK